VKGNVAFDEGDQRGVDEPVDFGLRVGAFEIAQDGQRGGDIAEGGGFDDEKSLSFHDFFTDHK
jgi:hypothetical protein